MIRPTSILLSLAACSIVGAQTTVPTTFDRLLADLSGADWAKRQTAEDAIVDMGPAAAAPIADALAKAEDLEVRERLQSALSRISREELLLPTIVTIQQKFDRPIDAYKALAAKVDLAVTTENDEAATLANEARDIEINIDKKSWLEALSEVTAKTNVNVRLDDGKMVLLRSPPGAIRRPTSLGGAVAISADNAKRRQNVDLTADNNNVSGNITLRLAAMTEPKIRFRPNTSALVLSRMLDEQGQSILADTQRRIPLQRESGGRMIAQYGMNPGGKGPVAVSLIEGELQGEIVTRTNDLRVDDLSSLPQSIDSPNGEMVIDSMVRAGNNLSQLTMQIPQAARLNISGQLELVNAINTGEFRILDQNGEPMRTNLTGQQGINNILTITLTVTGKDATTKPTKLIWSVPSQLRSVKIPFTLRDLPMPQ